MDGTIIKALSGFYYVISADEVYECRARGKFRLDGTSPMVGDRVSFDPEGKKGYVTAVHERKNFFIRPAVANIDALVFIAANTNPVTDPFLIDRVSVITEEAGCELIVCINKADIDPADELYGIYTSSGFETHRVSAKSGVGIAELKSALKGKICAFTGNSGVGKSSILNTYIADTPGFASFEIEMMQTIDKSELQYDFRDFKEYIGSCRFADCAHLKEPGCAVTAAVKAGSISKSRYESYSRLYELAAKNKFWENK